MIESPTTSKESFFKELREKTALYHTKLEETELSKAILKDDLSKEEYIDYLKAMYAFEKPFEAVYFPLLADYFSDIDKRKRAELIEKDIQVLGGSVADLELETFNTSDITLPEAIGAMYVMQGSSLGGRVILKHVNKHLGLEAENGASYFHGFGAETGRFWTTFLDEMWTLTAENPDQDKIIGGAVETFRVLYERFSR